MTLSTYEALLANKGIKETHKLLAAQELYTGMLQTWALDTGMDCGLDTGPSFGLTRNWLQTTFPHYDWSGYVFSTQHSGTVTTIVYTVWKNLHTRLLPTSKD